jgi:hypothetical protein
MHLVHREFVIDAPLDQAWAHLARVEQWVSWAKHIRRVELTPRGEVTAQTKGVLYLSNGLTTVFKMVEFEPGRSWKWVGDLLWLRIEYDHQFEAVNDQQTRMTWNVDGEGAGIGIFGRLFAIVYNGNLNRAIPNLIAELKAMGGS